MDELKKYPRPWQIIENKKGWRDYIVVQAANKKVLHYEHSAIFDWKLWNFIVNKVNGTE